MRGRIAVVLGGVGGYVDGVGFLALFGLFIAHMSGNTTHLGVGIGSGKWDDVVAFGFPILVFVIGVTVGALVSETLRERRPAASLAVMLGLECSLLVVLIAAGAVMDPRGAELARNSPAFFVLVSLAVLAMAVQSVVLRKVGAAEVHTTFITGIIVQVGVQAAIALREHDRDDVRLALRRLYLSGGVLLAYLAGAIAGAFLEQRLNLWALVLPAAVVGVAAMVARRRGLVADAAIPPVADGGGGSVS